MIPLIPIENLPRIGISYAKKLKKIGLHTLQDLLFYFPIRYEDFSNIITISAAKREALKEKVCIQGEIKKIENIKTFRKKMIVTEAVIEDETEKIKAVWFNQPFLIKTLKKNDIVCLAGKIDLYKDGLFLSNPVFEKINKKNKNIRLTHTGRIVPIYSETKGLTSRWLRSIIKSLLYQFSSKLIDPLPLFILKKYKLLPLKKALWQIHFPTHLKNASWAKERFSFEELFFIQLSVLQEKLKLKQKKSLACPLNIELMKEFTRSLPFRLTDSQKKCAYQILKDLEKPLPMSRLLEGDVGSGKTVVAAMAALNTVKCAYQVALMAPTEILAKQHFQSFSQLLGRFDVKIGLLTSKEARVTIGKEVINVSKKKLLKDNAAQKIDILIGTHSLIQKGVEFKNLALVILDEQHRFGVEQRAKLTQNKNTIPHLLSMTATPIPRTLALTLYGDLDLSLLTEMPKNRKKVKTFIINPFQRQKAYDFIRKEVKKGRGVFVICPKIESSRESKIDLLHTGEEFSLFYYDPQTIKKLEIKAVKEEYKKLSTEIFPDLRIGMLHGKMKPKEKEKVILDFKNKKIDILVSTSVVEVGIDIPHATIILIEGAERFGLAQLHQFRGRVGRSELQSYCFLFTTSPDQLNKKRLKALIECDNGFELAQKDLEIRGPGSLFGTQQWGLPDIAMEGLANLSLVEKTRETAKEILEKDPGLQKYPLLKEKLKTIEQKIHLE